MRIKELEIDNFKSFANKVTIPFLQGFTAVSGPNGSGKSNIIDSILFALGLSTSRTLRSEKGVSDLISYHNNRNETSVKVTFETDDKLNPEISFTRKVKKTSQGFTSTYYMNGKPVTLSQMHFELEKYNITPNSYNVIMQGDVTSIANCSPNERRKILDEIAGVADFDRKIELAKKELDDVEATVEKSKIILDSVNERLETLSAEREVALKYKKLKDEKTDLESKINVVRYFDTKKNLDIAHQNILNAQKDLKDNESEIKKIDAEIETQETILRDLNDEIRKKGEDKQLEVKRQAEEKKGQINTKELSLNFSDKTIGDNIKTIQNAKNGIENAQAQITKTEENIENKQKELEELNQKLNDEKEKLNKVLLDITGVNKTAQEHISARNELKEKYEKLNTEDTDLLKESLPLESELKAQRKELAELEEIVESYNSDEATSKERIESLELQIEQLKQEMDDCKLVQQKTFDEKEKTKTKIADMEYSITMADRKIAHLEATKQAYKSVSLGVGLETVLNSNIKGVYAPLGQLIDVDGEYVDAINVALGSRAKFVIVENEHVAVQAIEILKSINKDRATFLPLNKMKAAPNRLSLPKDKGVIDYAINLIDFDDKYMNAMFFALGETLVVEDAQIAKKLIGKYRIVTLDGEIFEKSGAITGGAKRSAGLIFGKNEDKELQTFKERLEEFKSQRDELKIKDENLDKRLRTVREDFSKASNEYNAARAELQNFKNNQAKNGELIEKKYLRINEISASIPQLEKRVDKIEEKRVSLSDEILIVKDELDKVEKLIDESELNKLNEQTKGFEENIKKLNEDINKITNDIDKEKNTIEFQKTIIAQRQEDIEKLTNDNKQLEQDKIRFNSEIEELKKVLAELEIEINKLGENLVELQNKRGLIQDKIIEIKNNKNQLENKIEQIQERINSYKTRRSELEPILEVAKEELENAGVNISQLEPTELSIDEINNKITRLQKRMEELEPVNMKALLDYDEVYNRVSELSEKIKTLMSEKTGIEERMTGYEILKKETFLNTYHAINENFSEIFTALSDGSGTLVLENEKEPFSGGLTFEATTRDKVKQKLVGMSGGEKSLTALAFVFAIQKYLPAPFYAFDEVDMHLDTINVEKLASMVNNGAKKTQFIVISLRKPMIDSADRMIGVTQKNKGVTKISGVKLKDE